MTPKEQAEVQEIIDKSGNAFHARVAKLLRDNGWTVLISPYYSDNFTDKPRELDIIAEKNFDIAFMGKWLGKLTVRIFVECKYINNKTVFWFDAKDKQRATERVMADTGLEDPHSNNSIETHHYFLDTPVAKLFSSEKNRGEENEVMNKAINQNLNAVVYYRNRKSIIYANKYDNVQVLKIVSYPIIAVNTLEKFYRTKMSDGSSSTEVITEPFQLEVNYAYIDAGKNGCNEYFLIDVISIDKLADFLANLEKTDIQKIREKISWDKYYASQK